MKHACLVLHAALGVSVALMAQAVRADLTDIGVVKIRPDGVNVVVAKGAATTVRFAADEMTNRLSRVLGSAVPVSSAPVEGTVNIFLGENEWSRAESLDPKPLVRDGFISAAKGNGVYLLGVDDAQIDPRDTFTWRADLSKAEQDAYIRRAENVMKGW